MIDRAQQALYLLALIPVAETTADGNSYGFRPERSTADAIGHCFQTLAKKRSAGWVMEGDIRGCYDNISHEWMLHHIPTDKEVLRRWLKAGFVENRNFFPTVAGTPQGGIISPTLANLTLDGLEQLLKDNFPPKRIRKQTIRFKVNLTRYADDFIITGNTKELLEKEVKPLVEQFLRDRGLQLSPEKTCITPIEQGIDFLGQNLRKFGDKLLIQPSKKSIKAFLDKVRTLVHQLRGQSQAEVIRQLNPVIRGWTNYHRHIAAKHTFRKVEWAVGHCLWCWAKRRHPGKSAHWIVNRYWHSLNGRKVFAAETGMRTQAGQPAWFRLVLPTATRILRHVKIKAAANPYDPLWFDYFEDRAFFKRLGIHRWEAGLSPSSSPVPLTRGDTVA